ncbi:MAG: hypothetical protein ACK4V6_12905 [Microthrixaceae bacterium]
MTMSNTTTKRRCGRLATTMASGAILLASGTMTTACAGGKTLAPEPTPAPDSAAARTLEETALEVAVAFADRDRGTDRTEAWLPQLRDQYETSPGVTVRRGRTPDDGLLRLTHTRTETYKCIAVTQEADLAGESVKIARIHTGRPRC